MKILAVSRYSWKSEYAGGSEYRLEKTLKGLVDRGHSVTLLSSKHPELAEEEKDDGVKIVRRGADLEEKSRIQYFTLSVTYYLEDFDEDITFLNMRTVPYFLPRTSGTKVGIFHERFSRCFSGLKKYIGRFLEWLNYGVLERNTSMIAVSRSSKEEIDNSRKIRTIPVGFDTENFPQLEKTENPSVVFVGRLKEKKGVDMLLDIYQELSDNVEFHVIGSDPEQQIKKELESIEEDNFFYHGHLDFEQKNKMVSQAWVQVVPSTNEGWGLVVTEASIMGTLSVASDVRGLRDSVEEGKNGYLVDRNVSGFVEKIEKIIEDKDLRKQLEESSREVGSRYTVNQMVDKTEEFFEEMK